MKKILCICICSLFAQWTNAQVTPKWTEKAKKAVFSIITYDKDNKMTVEQYINQSAKDFGFAIKLVKFVTYEKGEGLEKRQDDFASEVASMTK